MLFSHGLLYVKAGSSQANAAKVAEVLVLADARGISSHGTNRLELYCDEVKRKAVVGEGAPVLEKDTPACGYVNGNNLQGAVVGTYCMELAIKKVCFCVLVFRLCWCGQLSDMQVCPPFSI